MAVLLGRVGPATLVPVMSGSGADGEITLDAWWVSVNARQAESSIPTEPVDTPSPPPRPHGYPAGRPEQTLSKT